MKEAEKVFPGFARFGYVQLTGMSPCICRGRLLYLAIGILACLASSWDLRRVSGRSFRGRYSRGRPEAPSVHSPPDSTMACFSD